MLRWKLFRSPITAFLWFLIMNLLFCLPGPALPDTGMVIPHFDKWAHIGFFGVLLFLVRSSLPSMNKTLSVVLFFSGVLYGWIVELVQDWWIPLRSFDTGDIGADAVGCLVGLLIWWQVYKKNRPL